MSFPTGKCIGIYEYIVEFSPLMDRVVAGGRVRVWGWGVGGGAGGEASGKVHQRFSLSFFSFRERPS